MRGGDISNESPPRFLITWDVLAELSAKDITKEAIARKLHRWRLAVRYWEIRRDIVGRMALAETRLGIRWEMAVFDRPHEFCDELAERLDAENIGVANITPYVSPLALAGSLAYRPDIYAVIDIPERGLFYGSRGLDPRSL